MKAPDLATGGSETVGPRGLGEVSAPATRLGGNKAANRVHP